jgi:hypothetical protein
MSERPRLEGDIPGQDARGHQPVEEPAAEPGRPEVTLDATLRRHARLHELEHVLELELLAPGAGSTPRITTAR